MSSQCVTRSKRRRCNDERLAEAHRARNRGRDRRAIALYRRILLEDPHNVDVGLRLAPMLARRGHGFESATLRILPPLVFPIPADCASLQDYLVTLPAAPGRHRWGSAAGRRHRGRSCSRRSLATARLGETPCE